MYTLCIISVIGLFSSVCGNVVVEKEAGAEKVRMYLLYETLCGGCHHFIIEQLKPVHDELHEIMELDIVPYGHASGSNGNYECQHGPVECQGNMLHACAIKYSANPVEYVNYLACMEEEGMENPLQVGESCANKLNIDWNTINTCYEVEGNDLFEEMGRKNAEYAPERVPVPSVGINGKESSMATIDLKPEICNA